MTEESRNKRYFVPLKAVRPLLEVVQPLDKNEWENLRGYLRSLLNDPADTYLLLERFYAFASAVDSIAYRKGEDQQQQAREIIFEIARRYGPKKDGDGSLVPVGGPKTPPPLISGAELELPDVDLDNLFSEDGQP